MNQTRVADALAAADAAVAALGDLEHGPIDSMNLPDCLATVDRLEHLSRRITAAMRPVLARLAEADTSPLGGGRMRMHVADRLRITPADASRRLREAVDLVARTTVTGAVLPPRLVHTAEADRAGVLGDGHIRVIREFLDGLPTAVPFDHRQTAEARLADLAREMRPDELRRCAHRIIAHLAPDSVLTDRDRAAKRYFRLGPQRNDKMRSGSFCIDPELGAYLETLFAKLAAPGVNNPDDDRPTIDGPPDPDAIARDTRTPGQRCHDALTTVCRDMLVSGRPGSHRGLPVTVIATATVADLAAGAGTATTGGGSLLPIRDLIRMATRGSHQYLSVFDDEGRPLYFGRSKRLASADQRLVLHARDRGCTFPGCPVPAYHCESHHVEEWSTGGPTDIDNLTLVCPTHHRMIGSGRWRTVRRSGRTGWIPPRHVDRAGRARTNSFHHPEESVGNAQPP